MHACVMTMNEWNAKTTVAADRDGSKKEKGEINTVARRIGRPRPNSLPFCVTNW
jgi:hypothetical protein